MCLGTAAVMLATGAWLALDAWRAGDHLRDAEGSAARLQVLLTTGDASRAKAELVVMRRHISAARAQLSGPLWTVASTVPWLGRTPSVMRDGVTTIDDVSRHVLPALVSTMESLTAPELRPAGDRIDLDVLRAALPELRVADARLRRLSLHRHRSGVLPLVAERRAELATRLSELSDVTHAASTALALLPAALGGDGRRHYFLAFQNPSESRGTGGLVGAYGILTADDGVIAMPVLGDALVLERLPKPRVDLGSDHRRLYGPAAAAWANTNLSPHFPYAAQAWIDSWEQHTGRRLDGVLATDPVGLSHLLHAVGTVRLEDGTTVTSGDVVRRTSWDAYAEYDGRFAARKQFLVAVARAVMNEVLSGRSAGPDLLLALGRAADDDRLRVFSRRESEQRALAGTPLAGELPRSTAPFAAVVVNNLAGNKLDYHLRREVTYQLSRCAAASRQSAVRVVLTNAVPPGPLPPYASGRLDLEEGEKYEPGSNKLQVALYATTGAALRRLTVDGAGARVAVGTERAHPVFAVPVTLARGQTRTLEFLLVEPRTRGAPEVLVQPLIGEQRTHIRARSCG